MAYTLDAAHRRLIGTEIAISAVLSAVLPTIGMWILVSPFPMPMWGDDGFASFLAKNTFGMATVMTLIMTLAVRRRVGRGGAPTLAWDRGDHRWLRLIPRSIVLRAPLYGFVALAVIAPIGFAVAVALRFDPVDRLSFLLFNAVYSAVIAALLTPLILIGAMSDPIGGGRPATA